MRIGEKSFRRKGRAPFIDGVVTAYERNYTERRLHRDKLLGMLIGHCVRRCHLIYLEKTHHRVRRYRTCQRDVPLNIEETCHYTF